MTNNINVPSPSLYLSVKKKRDFNHEEVNEWWSSVNNFRSIVEVKSTEERGSPPNHHDDHAINIWEIFI